MKRNGLTPKQERFVAEYLIDLNAAQAYIRAGYSKKTAATCGPRLLRNAHVRAAVDAKQGKQLAKTDITAEEVKARLANIARIDPAEVYEDDGTLKPLSEMKPEVRQSISSIKKTVSNIGAPIEEVKFDSRISALDILAKHFGLLKERPLLPEMPGGTLLTIKWADTPEAGK